MQLVRFQVGERVAAGVLDGRGIRVIGGSILDDLAPTGEEVDLDAVRLLAPVLPSKVVGVGRNYRAHASEFGHEVPEEPLVFLKPSTSVIGPGDAVPLPPMSRQVEYEGELAVVIGRPARNARAADSLSHVLGYCCANDVTLRDLQRKDGQWARAKGFDGSCPLGPWIETELDPSDLRLQTRVNGVIRQDARTSEMVFDVATVIEFVSEFMTLLPGDVILSGTPEGVGGLVAGDSVEVEVEGVGSLANPVGASAPTGVQGAAER